MQGVKISFPILGDKFVIDPPTYFTVFGSPVHYYAIIIAFGFILAVVYLLRRRRDFGLTEDNILDIFIIAVPSGIVGARLYYVIFNPESYFGPGKWGNIFKIWEGGLAIYGGIIAAAAAVLVYSRAKKLPAGALFDAGALGLLIGQSVGRWGNFINREAYGGETDLPWKMGLIFPTGTIYVHPTFLYESLWNLAGFVILHFLSKKRRYDGQVFLQYVAWYGVGRFLIEGLRTDSLLIPGTQVRVSQLLAALSFGAAAWLLLRNRLRARRSPDSLSSGEARVASPGAGGDAAPDSPGNDEN